MTQYMREKTPTLRCQQAVFELAYSASLPDKLSLYTYNLIAYLGNMSSFKFQVNCKITAIYLASLNAN
jgi:hypothetical protein